MTSGVLAVPMRLSPSKSQAKFTRRSIFRRPSSSNDHAVQRRAVVGSDVLTPTPRNATLGPLAADGAPSPGLYAAENVIANPSTQVYGGAGATHVVSGIRASTWDAQR